MRISDWSSGVCSSDLAVTLRVGDHLHEAVGLVVGLGAAVRHHREFADLDLTAFFRLLFGQADTGDFGPGVDDRRDDVDRTRVVEGTSVSVRVDFGGRRIIKKKNGSISNTNHDY